MSNLSAVPLFIGNSPVQANNGEVLPVINPANGELIAEVMSASIEDIDAATAAAAAIPFMARGAIKSGPYQSFMSQQRYNLNDPGFQANLARFATQGVLRQ